MKAKEYRENARAAYRQFESVMRSAPKDVQEAYQKDPTRLLEDPLMVAAYMMRMGMFNDGLPRVNSAAESEMAQFTLRWASLSCPTFVLDHDTTAAAILTDCAKLTAEDVRLPFPALLLQLPHPGFLSIDIDGTPVEAPIICVHRYTTNIASENLIDPLSAAHFSSTVERSESLMIHIVAGEYELRTRCPIDRDMHTWVTSVDNPANDEIHNPWDSALSETDRSSMKTAQVITANVIAYINDLSVKGAVNLSQKHRTNGNSIFKVPSPIKLGPELVAAARSKGLNEPLWKLQTRFIVRGHWRNQACGPELSERKQRWIAPYWKGPVDGEVLARTYKV